MDKADIIKYQLPDEIIKYINKKKDLYNIILVCRAWYNYGIKHLYKDFSYEYTLLKIPSPKELEWVRHYHTWIDAAEEKRHFQLYTLIKGMKRLESIHIDIFGHIKYFRKYKKFLYKLADLKKDQIKKLHISLDILDENISDTSLIKFKTIFTQFIKIFKNLDVLILESGEENPFIDIQRLMIECLTDIYDHHSSHQNSLLLTNSHSTSTNRTTVTLNRNMNTTTENENTEQGNENENNNIDLNFEDENEEDQIENESDDEEGIISDIEFSSSEDEEEEDDDDDEENYYKVRKTHGRHLLKKLIVYDNSSTNLEESLSDIVTKIPLKDLSIRSYLPKHISEPIATVTRNAEPFWRIRRYKRELINEYSEYFPSLSLEDNKFNQFTDYDSFCNRSKEAIFHKLYSHYNENMRNNGSIIMDDDYEEEDTITLHSSPVCLSTCSSTSSLSTLTNCDSLMLHSSSVKSTTSTLSNISNSSCKTMINSFSSECIHQSIDILNHISSCPMKKSKTISTFNSYSNGSNNTNKKNNISKSKNNKNQMDSLCLENCQSISVNLFTIIAPKLNHLSTLKLNNISFLPEFCVLKLLIGTGKNLRHLELNMASHQLTTDILVCIATENTNLNTLYLKGSEKSLVLDVETINWVLTLCQDLYLFRLENAEDSVHKYYKEYYNLSNSSLHHYKKTILNKTAIQRIQNDTIKKYEKLMNL